MIVTPMIAMMNGRTNFNMTIPEVNQVNVWRTYDGSQNNLEHPSWGQAHQALLRQSSSDYADNLSTLAVRSPNNPNPRTVSNNVCKETTEVPNSRSLSNMVWIWGQFLDHEIDLTPTNSSEPINMTTPSVITDPEEDYPGRTIPMNRSIHVQNTGVTTPREQPNEISAFIDGTNVYGSNTERALVLRLQDGSGKLKTSLADNKEVILPYNTEGLPNDNGPSGDPASSFFLAGDIRANENILLTSIHSLFVREHNRLCDDIIQANPTLMGNDEVIYQKARSIVIGIMQNITFDEFLPALIGSQVATYQGYDKFVNPGIKAEFSTAIYRLGHSMIPSEIQIGDNPSNNIQLRDAFFQPTYIQTNGIDQLLLGGTTRIMNQIDGKIVEDLRSFLFGPPTNSMLHDLAALNIQRGRDHGLPGYNDVREAYGLTRKPDFSHFVSESRTALETLYTDVDSVDPWIGALSEERLSGSSVGELIKTVLLEQFQRLRDGDRFWFERDPNLTEKEKATIRRTTLSDIITRNTEVTVAENVFFV